MARRKIVVAMMMHETNTFSPVPTPLASFRPLAWVAAIEEFRDTNTQLGGFLGVAQKAGAEIVMPVAGGAHPSGYVEKSAYEDRVAMSRNIAPGSCAEIQASCCRQDSRELACRSSSTGRAPPTAISSRSVKR
jgi:hypothetical protein